MKIHPDWSGTKRAVHARTVTNFELIPQLLNELEERRKARRSLTGILGTWMGARSGSEYSGYELKRLYELLGSPQESYKDDLLYVMPVEKAEKLLNAAQAKLADIKANG